jgi:hypothetical protein
MLGSTTSEDAAIAAIFGSGSPASFDAHLYEGDPTDDGVEVSATSYAPISVTNNTTNFPAPAGGETTTATVDFGTVGAGDTWGVPDYWALTDGSGNFYLVQQINNPTSLDDGEPVTLTATITAQ